MIDYSKLIDYYREFLYNLYTKIRGLVNPLNSYIRPLIGNKLYGLLNENLLINTYFELGLI